jgi:hypothetical protein
MIQHVIIQYLIQIVKAVPRSLLPVIDYSNQSLISLRDRLCLETSLFNDYLKVIYQIFQTHP